MITNKNGNLDVNYVYTFI